MTFRERQRLDEHITGHYGEDYFKRDKRRSLPSPAPKPKPKRAHVTIGGTDKDDLRFIKPNRAVRPELHRERHKAWKKYAGGIDRSNEPAYNHFVIGYNMAWRRLSRYMAAARKGER